MFHIVIHCKPKEENEEYFGKVINADASILIDYKDYDGAMLFNIRNLQISVQAALASRPGVSLRLVS